METETAKSYLYKKKYNTKDTQSNSEFITIYENDLKYIDHNDIDLTRIFGHEIDNYDNVNSRIQECIKSEGQTLDLSHLGLKQFPKIPSRLIDCVKYLFLSNNMLTSLPDLSAMKNIIVIDLCGNMLTELPELPENIEELTLINNAIKDITKLSNYNHLKRLDCSYNQVNSIPIIDSLKILNANHNNLTTIPKLKNLIKLSCTDNKINELSELPNLEILECDRNFIVEIDSIGRLKQLYCSKNQIKNIKSLDNIEIIHCNDNNLHQFEYFNTLKELLCDYKNDINLSKNYTISYSSVYMNNIILIHFK